MWNKGGKFRPQSMLKCYHQKLSIKGVPIPGRSFSCGDSVKKKKSPDIRTLCRRCREDYELAGFVLDIIHERYREPCDICGRPGHNYIVSKPVWGRRF